MPGHRNEDAMPEEQIGVPDPADLAALVAARFIEVNGKHPMTGADDAYVDNHYVSLAVQCRNRAETADEVRDHMLAGRLPLPGYLRSDGAEMTPPNYFQLADAAGGIPKLAEWFMAHWSDREYAAAEWHAYLDGHYVCLRSATPPMMRRKDELVAEIRDALADPAGDSPEWLERLHALVDELDGVLADFTGYDRLRFGGPVSRDIYVDEARAKYPRHTALATG